MKEYKASSLKVNMILNTIKGLLSILFPIITFPYVCKILGVENVGKYNFSNSIISYFVLLAGLGIKTYAIREGARIREDALRTKQFANQVFTINIIATALSYTLLFTLIAVVPKLESYRILLYILSIQILFNTIGVEWIYSIYEDYLYITIRSILFHIISLVLLFVFVKSPSDLNIYAAITVLSNVGANVLNYTHARKYVRMSITRSIDWKSHIRPILVLFATQVAIFIYTNSDLTILGFIWDDETVGIYSVSAKVYSIVKMILSSIIVVSIPRLSATLGQDNKDKFNEILDDIYATLLTIIIPAVLGLCLLRRQVILIISDNSYLQATSSLVLLSLALLFALGAWFWGQCVLVPLKREAYVFKVTMISSIVNIVLNFILIPIWKENAAAFTTLLAEGIAFIMQRNEGRKYTRLNNTIPIIGKIFVGCLGIVICYLIASTYITGTVLFSTIVVSGSVLLYGLIEIVVKNPAVAGVKTMVCKIMRRI